MPTYSIQGPDGKTYSIDGPEGATRDQVIGEIKRQHREQNAPTYAGETTKGAARGLFADVPGQLYDLATFKGIREMPEWYVEAKKARGQDVSSPLPFQNQMPTPSGAEKISQGLGIEPDKDATLGQRMAGSAAEAAFNPETYLGAGSWLWKLVGGLVGGAGSEVGGELGQDIGGDTGEAAGRAIGGAIPMGVAGKLERRGEMAARGAPTLHTEEEIKTQSNREYTNLRNNPVQLNPQQSNQVFTGVKRALNASNTSEISAPGVHQEIEALLPPNQAGRNTSDMLDVHNKLSAYFLKNDEAEARAAHIAREAIRNEMIAQLGPAAGRRLQRAMGNWASQEKLKDVRQSLDSAILRASSTGKNTNRINTMRQEIRKIIDDDTRSAGYSETAREQAERIVSGGPRWSPQNISRDLSKILPYSPGAAALITALTGTVNVWIATGAGIVLGARHLGEFMTERQIRQLERILQEDAPFNAQAAARLRNMNSAKLTRARGTQAQVNADRARMGLPPIRVPRQAPGTPRRPHAQAVPNRGMLGTIVGGATGVQEQHETQDPGEILANPSGIPLR